MGSYTIFYMFENPRRGSQARNFTANVPKILDLKSSSEQIFSENCRWVPLLSIKPPSKVLGKNKPPGGLIEDLRYAIGGGSTCETTA